MTSIITKIKIVQNQVRLYKFIYDDDGVHESMHYIVLNRDDVNTLTDICLYNKLLPNNFLYIRDWIKKIYECTEVDN